MMRTFPTLARVTGHVNRAAYVSLNGSPDRSSANIRKLEASGDIAGAIDARLWSEAMHRRRLTSTIVDEVLVTYS